MTDRPHEGKTAIVTGAASGIGAGIAERLSADGARVVVADIDAEGAARVAGALPGPARAHALDVTDEAAVDGLIAATEAAFGPPDIAVNNAGIIRIAPVIETDYADWQRLMQVNVDGVFLCARAAARAMVAAGKGGVIVNASSGAGRRGVPNIAGYCASKAAIIMLTQSMAVELAPSGIRVNCYTPGHIQTPFWEGIAKGFAGVTGQTPEEVVESFRATVPMGRFGTPADVAAAVSWLATEDAAFVSGQAIAMNGAEFPY
jgi:NAD(P)-dependent dehydrogenase (short-subunit alcohol dehydrogenase family)